MVEHIQINITTNLGSFRSMLGFRIQRRLTNVATNSGQRRPGNMRGGASGDVNSSFTQAQRIGLKNSFTQKRRPNRKLQNAEMHNSLKNSLVSIESLSLEDLDGDIFEQKANEIISPGDAPGSSNTDRHGDGPHDMSEVSLPTFDQQGQGNVW